MISSRAGQVWELRGVQPDARLILLTQVTVPSWGLGYEQGVHEGVYLSCGKPVYLTEAHLLSSAARVL